MIRTLVLSTLALAVAGSAIFRLYTETEVRAERITIATLEREKAHIQAEVDRLSFEVEVLESAQRLNELSVDRLPLAPGSARQIADDDALRDVLDPAARLGSRL